MFLNFFAFSGHFFEGNSKGGQEVELYAGTGNY